MTRLPRESSTFERLHKISILWVVLINGFPPRFCLPVRAHLRENLHFIICRLKVMLGTLLHFDRHVGIVLKIFCEPDSTEMAPAKFLNDDVPIDENFSNMNSMITTDFVIRHSFVLTRILLVKEWIRNHIFEWLKLRLFSMYQGLTGLVFAWFLIFRLGLFLPLVSLALLFRLGCLLRRRLIRNLIALRKCLLLLRVEQWASELLDLSVSRLRKCRLNSSRWSDADVAP